LERINISKIPGLHGWKLSQIVNHLKFIKPSLRYPNRVDRTKSNVLRALCDHYPNVWPGLPEIADKAHCSTAQARRALRELEFKDRLIVDINSRLEWRQDDNGRWTLQGPTGHTQGKRGGRGKNATVQYFICDRRILDIYLQQKAYKHEGKEARSWELKELNHGSQDSPPKLNHGNQQAQSPEQESPIMGAPKQPQAPPPMIEEPTKVLTDHKNQPPPTENLWGRMVDVWKEVRKENLSKAGWKKVQALPADGDTIVRAWAYWIKNRNLDGLVHPLIMFAEEFPETLAALQEHNQRQAAKAANDRKVDESAAACANWRKSLEAFAKQAKSGEIDSWVQENPAPPMLVQSDEGIARVEYADGIISMCKSMAERRAEKDREREHDDYGFCACPKCQPDFWKEEREQFEASV